MNVSFPEICLLIQVLCESCVRLIPETQSEMTDNTVTSSAEEQTTTHHKKLPESSVLSTLQTFDPVLEHMALTCSRTTRTHCALESMYETSPKLQPKPGPVH